MENKNWWKDAVVYQIYPRSFKDSNHDGIGDLNGITEKLDYLKNLGVDILWLSPIYQSPNDDNGYDISDYRSIMTEFGTMEDFDRLLEQAHNRGMKLMMDLVVNHTSDEHHWFKESRKSKDNPFRDFYIWRDGDENGNPPNRWESCFKGSAWEWDERTGQYYLHSFSRKQPELNWENPKVRDAVYDMMTWWCEKGIDGFRMDVISMISKYPGLPDGDELGNGYTGNTSFDGPRVNEFLREMNDRVLSKYKVVTVGECPGVDVASAKNYAGLDTKELNMIFQFETVEGSRLVPHSYGKWDSVAMTMPELRENFTKWQKGLEGSAWNSLFLDNHDQPRCVSRFGNDAPKYRVRSAKMLATMLHFLKGTPYIYEGEELGMMNAGFSRIEDYRDIESLNVYREMKDQGVEEEKILSFLKAVSRDNARTPMQWDDTEYAGFSDTMPWIRVPDNDKSINAAEEQEDTDSVFHYYRKLIHLRHTLPVMVDGVYDLILPDHPQIYGYTRTFGREKLLILLNYSKDQVKVPQEILDQIQSCQGRVLIHNYQEEMEEVMRPYEAIVYHFTED